VSQGFIFPASATVVVGQRECLRLGGVAEGPPVERHNSNARSAVPSDDPGEDRAVSSLDEERDQSAEVLSAVGAGAGDVKDRQGTTIREIATLLCLSKNVYDIGHE